MSFDNNIVVIKLNTVNTPISFPSQETNCTQRHFKFRASANEAASNPFLITFPIEPHSERLIHAPIFTSYVLFLSGKN